MNRFIIMFLSLISSIIFPLFSATFVAKNSQINKVSASLIFHISVCLAACAGACVMMKVPNGDLVRYLMWNEFARSVDYLAYVASFGFKDISYHSLNYLISNSQIYSKETYLFSFVFITYFFLIFAVLNFSASLSLSAKYLFGVALIVVLWGPLLSLSTQLIRQIFASALFSMFLSNYMINKKINLLLFIAPLTFHLSSFIPLTLFLICISRFQFAAVLFVIFSIFFIRLNSDFFLEIPFVGQTIIPRLVYFGRGIQLDALGINENILMLILSSVCLIFRLQKREQKNKVIFDLILYLIAVVYLLAVGGNFEISKRLFFYIYPIMFFLVPVVILKFKNKGFLLALANGVVALSFLNSVIFGVWEYQTNFLPLLTIFFGLI